VKCGVAGSSAELLLRVAVTRLTVLSDRDAAIQVREIWPQQVVSEGANLMLMKG